MRDGAESQDWIQSYLWLREYNTLPDEGGVLDQDARFVRAVNVIREETSTLKEFNDGEERRRRRSHEDNPTGWGVKAG